MKSVSNVKKRKLSENKKNPLNYFQYRIKHFHEKIPPHPKAGYCINNFRKTQYPAGPIGSMVYFVAVGMSPPAQASIDMLDSIKSEQLYVCNVTASLLIITMNCQ